MVDETGGAISLGLRLTDVGGSFSSPYVAVYVLRVFCGGGGGGDG